MEMATQTSRGRREEILEATLRVIGRSGRKAVTHRAVAEEAGVPLGSTTYYFDSRDDLLAQALQQVSGRIIDTSEETAERLAAVETADELADALCEWLVDAVAPGRNLFVAEYQLWLEAA